MSHTGMMSAADGTDLLIREWKAATPKAQMLIVHGIGEHSGRYEHVGEFFANRGFETSSFDLRGHGKSGGARVDVDNFSEFIDDLELVLGTLPQDRPTIVYGHSMGGLIALSHGLSDRPQPDLYVLSAPAMDADAPAALRIAAKVIAKIRPATRLPNSIKGEQLARDPEVGERYFADPLVDVKATARFGAQLLGQMKSVSGELDRLHVPSLVIHGAEDPLVPPRVSAPLAALDVVERKLFPGLRHEIHNEPESGEVLGFVANWIENQLA